MSDENAAVPKFPTDEEILAAIQRNQEEMRSPAGFDARAVIRQALRQARTTKTLLPQIFFGLVQYVHLLDARQERKRLKKTLKTVEATKKHIEECEACRSCLHHLVDSLVQAREEM